jgi:geranylgeranyl diphosphate synthase type II
MGALCGGAPEPDARYLSDFGFAVGMGFQIRDDYLDAFGDPITFGKKIGGDILNNKKTWLLVDAIHKATQSDQNELYRLLYCCHDPDEKVEQVIALYHKLHIPLAAEEKIKDFHQQAIRSLQRIGVTEKTKEQIVQYTASLFNRKK